MKYTIDTAHNLIKFKGSIKEMEELVTKLKRMNVSRVEHTPNAKIIEKTKETIKQMKE